MTKEALRQILLVRECKKGNRVAQDLLIKSILPFIKVCAKQKAGLGAPDELVDDLIQVASIYVLEKAIPKFDETLGITFLSFASYWIQARMNSYLSCNPKLPFHLPYNQGYDYRKSFVSNQKPKYKETEELRNLIFQSSVKDEKGIHDIFDFVKSEEEKDTYEKEVVLYALNHIKVKKPTKQKFLRRFNLGKYENYPEVSVSALALDNGIASQNLNATLKRVASKIREYLSKNTALIY